MPTGRRVPSNGFSLIELLIVVAIILIIAAIAIPSMMRARMSSNEASAVGSLRTMNTACVNYSATYQIGYPASLASLGPSASPSSTSADLLDSVLAAGVKSGYIFTYTPGTPTNGIINSYTITADPVNRGVSGQRSFYTDQVLVVHTNSSTTASAADPPLK